MKPPQSTLEDLYLSQRLTTRVIGEQFGVSKTHVLRWLKSYSIERRANGRGLKNRGIAEPSATELFNMVHTLHLSYEAIATKFGVDFTAVQHWLTRHNIQKPTMWETRYKGKPPRIADPMKLAALYESGASRAQLATQFGVSTVVITNTLRANGVTMRPGGFKGKRFTCNDGHVVMSIYEQRVDNWLSFHGISHELEPRLPFNRRCRGDFLVGNTYIEIWGVVGSPTYIKRREHKKEQYRKNGLKLVELKPHHFDVKRNELFARVLAKELLE